MPSDAIRYPVHEAPRGPHLRVGAPRQAEPVWSTGARGGAQLARFFVIAVHVRVENPEFDPRPEHALELIEELRALGNWIEQETIVFDPGLIEALQACR